MRWEDRRLTAKWVPVGREDLRERFFRNSQHSEIKGKGKRYDSGREVAMKCRSMAMLMNRNRSVKGSGGWLFTAR